MRLRLREVDLALIDCTARLPFRFGVATLSRAPQLTVRVRVDSDAGEATGFASELLVPRWFDKDPAKTVRDDVLELCASARAAAEHLRAAEVGTVFELWLAAYRARVETRPFDASDRLVRGFGVALLERALMDAACRAAGSSFLAALRADLFGFRPEALHAELAGQDAAASLPDAWPARLELRHTVGLVDPLRVAEIPPAERVADGLPQALDEDVARYGLGCFKLKVSGDRAADLERLCAIGRTLADAGVAAPRITLDGNEQYASLAELRALLDALRARPEGAVLLQGLLHVEQPLARAHTFDPARHAGIEALTADYAPLIVDEADLGLEAFPRAMALGYRGVSIKGCKGVFRALAHRGLCELTPPPASGPGWFQSGEDLTTLPAVGLQQDLALMAALGVAHVERNGHHYFRGLDHLPAGEARAALAAHPDLYRETPRGIELRVEHGALAIGSLDRPGFAHDSDLDMDARTPLADWRFPAEVSA